MRTTCIIDIYSETLTEKYLLEFTNPGSEVEDEVSDSEREEDNIVLVTERQSNVLKTGKKLDGSVISFGFSKLKLPSMLLCIHIKLSLPTMKKHRKKLPTTMFFVLTKKDLHEDTSSKTYEEDASLKEFAVQTLLSLFS